MIVFTLIIQSNFENKNDMFYLSTRFYETATKQQYVHKRESKLRTSHKR